MAIAKDQGVIELFLIRHGEVEGGKAAFYGHTDFALSPSGEAQMRAASASLKEIPLGAVYASDLKRAEAGGRCLALSRGLPLFLEPALRERSWGRWEGFSAGEVEARFPVEWEAWCREPLTFTPEGAEPTDLFYTRVTVAMNKILQKYAGGSLAIFCHGGVIRAVDAWLSNRWPEGFFDLHPAHGSLHRFSVNTNTLLEKFPPGSKADP